MDNPIQMFYSMNIIQSRYNNSFNISFFHWTTQRRWCVILLLSALSGRKNYRTRRLKNIGSATDATLIRCHTKVVLFSAVVRRISTGREVISAG